VPLRVGIRVDGRSLDRCETRVAEPANRGRQKVFFQMSGHPETWL